jgi:hypothetical protein
MNRRAAITMSPVSAPKFKTDDYHELLKHFEIIQEKHSRARHEALQNRSLKSISKLDIEIEKPL